MDDVLWMKEFAGLLLLMYCVSSSISAMMIVGV